MLGLGLKFSRKVNALFASFGPFRVILASSNLRGIPITDVCLVILPVPTGNMTINPFLGGLKFKSNLRLLSTGRRLIGNFPLS